jgi:hypothetical protein
VSYCGSALVKYYSQVAYSQVSMGSEAELNNFVVGTLIPQASKIIDNYVGHSFGTPSVGTFTYDGSGKTVLFLPLENTPFIGLTAGSVSNAGLTVANVKVHDQYLELDGGAFTKGKKNVTIFGSYGYVTLPNDIQFVCAQLAANVLVDMVRRKVYPDAFLAMAGSGGDAQALMASPTTFTKALKEQLDGYRVLWIDVG